jgi:energy-coupling factor transporter ATP-binding protein EcfA2
MALFVVLVRVIFRFIFGDRSFEGTIQSVVDGSKLAAWVLGFGLLNLVIDFRKTLNRLPKNLRRLSSPLAIALSLTPEMATSLLRIRENSKLRARRSGFRYIRSVLVPALTSAVDQAIQLADSMQARGFGVKLQNPSGEIKFEHLNFSYQSGRQVLRDVSIDLEPGSFTVICGRTGSGKSTLLKVIQAKKPGVGFVGQFPRQTFVADTVFGELSFALEQLGTGVTDRDARVSKVAADFGLDLNANPSHLSAGWQQRVAIAAALTSGSQVLILDEPFSSLDEPGTSELLGTLTDLKATGTTIIVAEHRVNLLTNLADRVLEIRAGSLVEVPYKTKQLQTEIPTTEKVTALFGNNGSGKTTYLRKLAAKNGVLVPQPASDLLFLDSVEDEFKQADLDAGKTAGTTARIAQEFKLDFSPNQNPRDLSEGQKLTLALAIQLVRETELLLLDEPTLGFDLESRQVLATTIRKIAESGVEVLLATHDREFAGAIATETVSIEQVMQNAR